ncbi:glycosyltransferase family 4 protein [Lyngbya confervoides]|uniref:Undecaprenyl/decaprenyl-phosphate alpha-N-acetylglucosaminyl 1-phosphate transferase n=1 Tax=Lyngbya confervoides BDU141951 TaxID=1574623 RepID=A0ABD4T122_9CYAN|nr:MraY family glycosyltransferase [Lyngbya confervoides]MCM1982295.1 undecaprenyl/decaprenyl-phosphate alpha-N-acetylglucosaminyl 1-phosphate transferase [Lyngbya confervoides BDU141951]
MPYHLVAFLIAVLVVLWTTPLVNKAGLRVGLVDLPNARKVHQRPMVRLGGIAIFTGYICALTIVGVSGAFDSLPVSAQYELWGVVFGGVGFFIIGLLDDVFTLSPFLRLALQAIVASLAWGAGVRIDFFTLPYLGVIQLGWLSLPVTMLWLVGMTNAINFMDGLDGLAAGISGIAAVVLLIVSLWIYQPISALLAAALAGASLGFLRYNFNPAQIFMGDGGAYFMGFTLAGISIVGLVKTVTTVAVILPFIILAIPILDTSTVIVDRILRGKSPFVADKRHLHHRLLSAGLSQRLSVLFIYALALWVGSVALVLAKIPAGKAYVLGATLLLGFAIVSLVQQAWKTRSDPQQSQQPANSKD